MIERFTEPQRAVAYLCSAMHESLVDAKVDVTMYPMGARPPQSRTAEGTMLVTVLEHLSDHFVEATAIYGLEVDGYPTGAIQCRCSKHFRVMCTGHCQHHEDRPIICVMAYREDHPPERTQRKKAVELLRGEIRRLKETGGNHLTRFYRG